MSFMSPGSKFGNVMSGIMNRLPDMIGQGGQLAQSIANIFDPSGGIGKKIGGITGAASQFAGNSRDTIRGMRNQWENGEYGGMATGVGDLMSHFGNMMNGFSQNASGVHGERMRRLGGYMNQGSDVANGIGAMIGSGQAMYNDMRGRVGRARGMRDRGDYDGYANEIAGGFGDMANFAGQQFRQGANMARPFMRRR